MNQYCHHKLPLKPFVKARELEYMLKQESGDLLTDPFGSMIVIAAYMLNIA